jgi:hypothetical protein
MAVDTLLPLSPLQTRQHVAGAIRTAANATGVSFDYLLATAKIESGFNPKAAARTSSARGLFQFIDQTWLGTVKEAGAALGYGAYSAAITRSPSGRYSVSDPATRAAILQLRHDPDISAAMAGVLTRSNGIKLGRAIGRAPTDAELYMAHFMGVGAATRLVTQAERQPHASGAALFPAAAAANRSIFYERSGAPRSVSQVYALLDSRYQAAVNAPATRTAIAALAAPPVAASDNATYLASFPQSPRTAPDSPAAPSGPIFRTLIQGGARAEPVSPAVASLWSGGPSPPSTPEAKAASFTERWPDVRAPTTLDLFSDRFGRFSS